jgi:hypothetical protein
MAVGDPTGEDLCVGTTNGNTLPEQGDAGEERVITFGSSVVLTSGIKYSVVTRINTEYDCLWVVLVAGSYGNGAKYFSEDSGSSWDEVDGQDFWFKTYASEVEKDSYTFVPENVTSPVSNALWLAQTFTTTSTYTITDVGLKLYRNPGESPGTVTVSIRKTVKAFDPPVPTGKNNMLTVRRLVGVANNKVWYESI